MAVRRQAGWIVAAILAAGWILSAGEPSQQANTEPGLAKRAFESAPTGTSTAVPKPPAHSPPEVRETVDAKPKSNSTLYATARVRMRGAPATSGTIVHVLEAGQAVQAGRREGRWYEVVALDRIGWVHGDYLSEEPLVVRKAPVPQAAFPKTTTPVRPATLFEEKPKRKVTSKPEIQLGQPIREAYVGTCDCPYDRKRNGHRCGRSSAYSRPGGRSPVCYARE